VQCTISDGGKKEEYLLYEEKKYKEKGKEGAATAGGCV
jgi:hypothetical protein